jgi:hypothetical protein
MLLMSFSTKRSSLVADSTRLHNVLCPLSQGALVARLWLLAQQCHICVRAASLSQHARCGMLAAGSDSLKRNIAFVFFI